MEDEQICRNPGDSLAHCRKGPVPRFEGKNEVRAMKEK